MKIEKATNSFKVADVLLNNRKTKAKILFDFKEYQPPEILRDKRGRVYIFVINGKIKKIGYSTDKKGIRGTLGAYQSGLSGNPSDRTHGIHLMTYDEIKKGNKVEIYMILSDWTSPVKVNGLFGCEKMRISPSHDMEKLCLRQYYEIEGKYPDWNFKENNE